MVINRIAIRTAIPQDAKQIASIHVRTWQCAYRGQIPESYLDSLSIEKRTKLWKDQLKNPTDGTHTFVAEKNGIVVGWCTTGINRDEDVTKDTGELYGIYMDPEFIGKGIGSELMKYALNVLKNDGYKKATLWVLTTNENSRKFYEKKGWKIKGKTKIDKRDDFGLHETRYITELGN